MSAVRQIAMARTAADLRAVREVFEAFSASLGIDLAYQDFAAELASLPGKYVPPCARPQCCHPLAPVRKVYAAVPELGSEPTRGIERPSLQQPERGRGDRTAPLAAELTSGRLAIGAGFVAGGRWQGGERPRKLLRQALSPAVAAKSR